MTILKGIVNRFEEYKKIIVNHKWVPAETAYTFSSKHESGLTLCTVRFPEGYLQTNFADAFVRTMLTYMSYSEEWNPDGWASFPPEERLCCLTEGEELYKEYLCFEKLRMQEMTPEEFLKDVRGWFPWARTEEELQNPCVVTLPDEAKKIFLRFSKAEALRIGGDDGCAPDENWLAVQDDELLFVSFHCSG